MKFILLQYLNKNGCNLRMKVRESNSNFISILETSQLVLKARHLEVKYVRRSAAKCFGVTKQAATNPGCPQPTNVNISTEFNGTSLPLLWFVLGQLEQRSKAMNDIISRRNNGRHSK